MPEDPYADAATGVLRNKLGLSTTGELEAAEREITHAALVFLEESPVQPSWRALPEDGPFEYWDEVGNQHLEDDAACQRRHGEALGRL